MSLANTSRSYGSITKTIHWVMFLMIITVIPVGLIAVEMAHDLRDPAIASTGKDFERTIMLFSLHKTLGLAIFLTALVRIIRAISQTTPGLLNADNRPEAFAAHLVHWLLYGSLLLVPLTGWLTHAATSGFAPVWWPFGQSLPFVPKDEGLAHTLSGIHMVLERVMMLSIFLHIAGALKHHFVDRDATLRRMLPGTNNAPVPPKQSHSRAPLLVALVIWGAALTAGVTFGAIAPWDRAAQASVQDSEQASEQASEIAGPASQSVAGSQWQVTEGKLSIAITQLGSAVEGDFGEWSANITFDETIATGPLGKVDVTIAIASLTLGSVSEQAMGPDFFDAEFFPEAVFSGEITRAPQGSETAYIATGPLTIRDTSQIITLPFDLVINADTAQMTGTLSLSRLDFGVAANMPDEGSLGWAVGITIALSATRN